MRSSALFLERFDASPGAACDISAGESARERRARAEGYAAGFAAAQAAAHDHAPAFAAAASAVSADYANAPRRIAKQAAGALKIILERLFPALARAGFAVEAAAAFARVTREAGASSLEIFTAPEHVDALRAELKRRAPNCEIAVTADPAAGAGAARASWSTGGIEIDLERTTTECLAALERAAQSIGNESEI